MRGQLVRIVLIAACLLDSATGRARASTAGPDKAQVEREARKIERMTADKDVDGLVEMLAKGTFPSKVRVAALLKDIGDRKALPELERANREFGGWYLRTPCDDRSGVFPVAIWKITTKDLPEPDKIDALLELIEGRGPIVPQPTGPDTIVSEGTSEGILVTGRPNFMVAAYAEPELEQFPDASVTTRLRKSENKGVAPYAVWRHVRDRPPEAAICRCVQIVHEEERPQQYGAIHCLRRFDHPNAILALDLLAEEGYSEAIRALDHFASRPDVFDRLCNHLLHSPYYVVRLFVISSFVYTEDQIRREKSLSTLVNALYDPSDVIRTRAAQSITRYMNPLIPAQQADSRQKLMIIQEDLLHAREHPDVEARSLIRAGLERIGWLGMGPSTEDAPRIRTDLKEEQHPRDGHARKKRMIALLEARAAGAVRKGDNDTARETYTKLFMLDPQNEAYRSRLPDKTPRLVMYYAKASEQDVDPEAVELDDYPILTEQHIVGYDWNTHTITLTKEGIQRIPASSTIGVRGRSFVIVADGQRCYLGAFWSSFSSISCPVPVINMLKPGAPIQSGRIQIERAYPSAKFGLGEDPRFDDRIKKILQETGKLVYSTPEYDSAKAAGHVRE